MLSLLHKIFVQQFFKANAGFFLFFFFLFFGAVQGGSLIAYHISLMQSIFNSVVTLLLVLTCWSLYHLKCIQFMLQKISTEESLFLHSLQAVATKKQTLMCFIVYLILYAPVFIYSLLLVAYGVKHGHFLFAVSIVFYQCFSIATAVWLLYHRLNHWIDPLKLPTITIRLPVTLTTLLINYLLHSKRLLFLVLKTISFLLLYIILIWNRGSYDNDSFLYFYLIILMAHAVLPYLFVQFSEAQFQQGRNLPIAFLKRAGMFMLPYFFLLLPEMVVTIIQATALPVQDRIGYAFNFTAGLFLLTAVQFTDGFNGDEYVKISFAFFFVTVFTLHQQAFWIWIAIQMLIATILFRTGFHRYQRMT